MIFMSLFQHKGQMFFPSIWVKTMLLTHLLKSLFLDLILEVVFSRILLLLFFYFLLLLLFLKIYYYLTGLKILMLVDVIYWIEEIFLV